MSYFSKQSNSEIDTNQIINEPSDVSLQSERSSICHTDLNEQTTSNEEESTRKCQQDSSSSQSIKQESISLKQKTSSESRSLVQLEPNQDKSELLSSGTQNENIQTTSVSSQKTSETEILQSNPNSIQQNSVSELLDSTVQATPSGAKTKTPRILTLSDIQVDRNTDCFAQLFQIETKTDKTGKPYYKAWFRDAKTKISIHIWSNSPYFHQVEKELKQGRFYKLRLTLTQHNLYGQQVKLLQIREVTQLDKQNGFDEKKCLPTTETSKEDLFKKILKIIDDHLSQTPYHTLVLNIIKENKTDFCSAPASRYHHRSYEGGLLKHTLSVTELVLSHYSHYCNIVPEIKDLINKPLLVASALLHDIGKISDTQVNANIPQYTMVGRLIGHETLGAQLIEAYAQRQEISEEAKHLLQHSVLSHSYFQEKNPLQKPVTLEAMILCHADYMDSTFMSSLTVLLEDSHSDRFTQRKSPFGESIFVPVISNENLQKTTQAPSETLR